MIGRILKIAALALAFFLVAGISGYLTLTLIIKSEDTVIVPDLVSRDVVYALELLTDLELNTKVKGSEYSSDIAKNHVVYQNPSPGSEIKKGRDVRIIISRGPKLITLPQLTTLSTQQARIILEENDLCLGESSRTHHESILEGHVISQIPSAGTIIARGACVDLLISTGRRAKAFKMPGVFHRVFIVVIAQHRIRQFFLHVKVHLTFMEFSNCYISWPVTYKVMQGMEPGLHFNLTHS